MMNDMIILAPALAAGVLLGAMFYGGLWWTVQKGLSSPRAARWFFISGLLRTIMVVAGFYSAARGDWQRLLACLLGFVLSRLIVTRLTRMAHKPTNLSQEAGHAS